MSKEKNTLNLSLKDLHGCISSGYTTSIISNNTDTAVNNGNIGTIFPSNPWHITQPSNPWNITQPSNQWSWTISSLETINVLGIDLEFNFISNEIRLSIATLNFNGYRFWNHLKKAGISFGEDNDKKIEDRVKILSRKEKLNNFIK
jgi:hypothetical protein